jgi:hypothetical protein
MEALLSELTLSERGNNVTHLLKARQAGGTTALRFQFPYSVSLLNFMANMFVTYWRYR